MENNGFIYVLILLFMIIFLFDDDNLVEDDCNVVVTVQTENETVTSKNKIVCDSFNSLVHYYPPNIPPCVIKCRSDYRYSIITKTIKRRSKKIIPPSDSILSTLDINWNSYIVDNGVIIFIDNPTIAIKEHTPTMIKKDKKFCLFIDGKLCNNVYTLKSLHTTESGKVNAIMNMYNYRLGLSHDKSLVKKIISTKQGLEYDAS